MEGTSNPFSQYWLDIGITVIPLIANKSQVLPTLEGRGLHITLESVSYDNNLSKFLSELNERKHFST